MLFFRPPKTNEIAEKLTIFPLSNKKAKQVFSLSRFLFVRYPEFYQKKKRSKEIQSKANAKYSSKITNKTHNNRKKNTEQQHSKPLLLTEGVSKKEQIRASHQ